MARITALERYIGHAVSSAKTPFEQLVFLGSLRDAYTGAYIHEGWAAIASQSEIDKKLRHAHQLSFESVLRLSVIELGKQLRCHFQSIGQLETNTYVLWLEREPFRELVPPGCSPVLRELFVSQVRTVLEVFRRVPDWPEVRALIELQRSQPGRPPLPRSSN